MSEATMTRVRSAGSTNVSSNANDNANLAPSLTGIDSKTSGTESRLRNVASGANANANGSGSELRNGDVAGAVPDNEIEPEAHAPEVKVEHQWTATTAFILVAIIFVISVCILFGIYTTFPDMDPSDHKHFKMPRTVQEASSLAKVLGHYTDQHYIQVMSGIGVFYIFLQTFAIPGSIFLSVMCGCLFNWKTALFIICFCSATGATCCYLISLALGRRFVRQAFPNRIESWSLSIQEHRDNIVHYMVFLRITPFLPNWFINVSAPVLDVPIFPFYIGTFFGVAVPSLVAIYSGTMLHEYASSGEEPIAYWKIGALAVFGFIALVPVLLKNWLRSKVE